MNSRVQWLVVLTCLVPGLARAQESVETTTTPFGDERLPSGFVERVDIDDAFTRGESAADVVADVPGINVRRQSSLGQSAYVQVRGGNPRQVNVLLDGYRINAPFGVGFDLGVMRFPGIDRITVYKGAAATLAGGGALTGALDLLPNRRQVPHVRAGTIAGSFGTLGAEADASARIDQTQIRLAGQALRSEGNFAFVDGQGDTHTRTNNASKRAGVLMSVAKRFDRTHRGRATVLWDGGTRSVPGPSEFQDLSSDARVDEQRVVAVGRYDIRDAFRLANFRGDVTRRAGGQRRYTTFHSSRSLLGDQEVSSTSEYISVGGGASSTGFDGPWVLQLAVDTQVNDYEGTQTDGTRVEARRSEYGLAMSVEWSRDGVSLLSGARFVAATGDRQEAQLLPSVGAVWQLGEVFSLRANLARTFRAPDFDELYLDLETLRGSASLAAEHAWNADLGVAATGERWAISGGVFAARMNNVIAFLPVSSLVIEAMNLDHVSAGGVELFGHWAPVAQARIDGSYTLTRSRRQPDGIQVPHQPLHQGFLRATFLPGAGLEAQIEAHGRTEVFLDNFGNLSAPGWTSFNAALSGEWETFRAGISVQNFLDVRTRVDALQQPLPGRAVFVHVGVNQTP